MSERLEKLRQMVAEAGGPANFVRKYSRADADKPIDPSYISQLLNGHRNFGERSAEAMAKRMGFSPDFFDVREARVVVYPRVAEPTSEFSPRFSQDELDLIEGFRLMGREMREFMLDSARKALSAKKEPKVS